MCKIIYITYFIYKSGLLAARSLFVWSPILAPNPIVMFRSSMKRSTNCSKKNEMKYKITQFLLTFLVSNKHVPGKKIAVE